MLTSISDNYTRALKQGCRCLGFKIRQVWKISIFRPQANQVIPPRAKDSTGSPCTTASSAYQIWETSISVNFWIRGMTLQGLATRNTAQLFFYQERKVKEREKLWLPVATIEIRASNWSWVRVTLLFQHRLTMTIIQKVYLIQNSPAVKKVCSSKKAIVKKDVKSKVAAKKWLWW